MPIRWMSPQALCGHFSVASDVWSYGVVLWEMVTLADTPYSIYNNHQVFDHVKHGKIMDKPDGCPDDLYDVMKHCWSYRENQRPMFLDICDTFLAAADERWLDHSYYSSPEGQKLSLIHI